MSQSVLCRPVAQSDSSPALSDIGERSGRLGSEIADMAGIEIEHSCGGWKAITDPCGTAADRYINRGECNFVAGGGGWPAGTSCPGHG